jgi:hypothetical protein
MYKILLRKSGIDSIRRAERRAAELHAAFDYTCAITSGHPFECMIGKVGRRRRLGVLEGDVVETQADLCVRGSSYPIELSEVLYVSGG